MLIGVNFGLWYLRQRTYIHIYIYTHTDRIFFTDRGSFGGSFQRHPFLRHFFLRRFPQLDLPWFTYRDFLRKNRLCTCSPVGDICVLGQVLSKVSNDLFDKLLNATTVAEVRSRGKAMLDLMADVDRALSKSVGRWKRWNLDVWGTVQEDPTLKASNVFGEASTYVAKHIRILLVPIIPRVRVHESAFLPMKKLTLINIITDHFVKDFFVATLASWPAHGSAMRSAGRAATPRWNATSRWLLAALPPFGHHRLLAPVLSLPYVTMPTVSGLARSLGQDDNGVTPILWGSFRMVPILHLVSDKRQPFQHASWPRLVAFINSDMFAISNKESRTSREACRSIRQRVLQRMLLKWFSYNLLAFDQSGHMNNKQLNYCISYLSYLI